VAQRKRQPQFGRYADRWLLDPEVVFLNHGSFGATPKAVLEEQTRIQRRIEALLVIFGDSEGDVIGSGCVGSGIQSPPDRFV
jgi:hypothetical protein